MTTITIKTNDSPKFYFSFKDIYGEPLEINATDFTVLKYSVSRKIANSLYPVEGYADVAIPASNWKNPPEEYPASVVGVGESSTVYNLELFPYTKVDGKWTSPFSLRNETYCLTVSLAYYMSDDALDGTAIYERSESVTIKTEND